MIQRTVHHPRDMWHMYELWPLVWENFVTTHAHTTPPAIAAPATSVPPVPVHEVTHSGRGRGRSPSGQGRGGPQNEIHPGHNARSQSPWPGDKATGPREVVRHPRLGCLFQGGHPWPPSGWPRVSTDYADWPSGGPVRPTRRPLGSQHGRGAPSAHATCARMGHLVEPRVRKARLLPAVRRLEGGCRVHACSRVLRWGGGDRHLLPSGEQY